MLQNLSIFNTAQFQVSEILQFQILQTQTFRTFSQLFDYTEFRNYIIRGTLLSQISSPRNYKMLIFQQLKNSQHILQMQETKNSQIPWEPDTSKNPQKPNVPKFTSNCVLQSLVTWSSFLTFYRTVINCCWEEVTKVVKGAKGHESSETSNNFGRTNLHCRSAV